MKEFIIFKFLSNKDLKTKIIKMAMLLVALFLTFLNRSFGCVGVILSAIFILFEFSADSIVWLMLTGLNVPYIKIFWLHILMWEFGLILLIRLIVSIVNKKFNAKDWKFITLVCLFSLLSIFILLPVSKSYVFSSQIKSLGMFACLILLALQIKEVRIKDILIIFSLTVGITCVLFLIAKSFGKGNDVLLRNKYSNGIVNRFSLFNLDPNFTGLALICAFVSIFFLYKKKVINKYLYFSLFTLYLCFSFMTISKATFIILALFGAYIGIENIVVSVKTKNAKHLLELLYYLGALLIAVAVCWKYVDATFYRFSSSFGNEEGDEMMSSLTTGRTDLWSAYIKAIFSSWQNALFGVGIAGDYAVNGTAAHCMFISYLYRYGLINVIILFTIFVVAILPYINKVKVYSVILPLIITGMLFSLGSTSPRYIYIFAIEYFIISFNGIDYKKQIKNNTDE